MTYRYIGYHALSRGNSCVHSSHHLIQHQQIQQHCAWTPMVLDFKSERWCFGDGDNFFVVFKASECKYASDSRKLARSSSCGKLQRDDECWMLALYCPTWMWEHLHRYTVYHPLVANIGLRLAVEIERKNQMMSDTTCYLHRNGMIRASLLTLSMSFNNPSIIKAREPDAQSIISRLNATPEETWIWDGCGETRSIPDSTQTSNLFTRART